MQTIAELMATFRSGTKLLCNMAERLNFPFDMDISNTRELHNMYARNLITSYTSKFAQLSETVMDSVEDQRFLVYALSGRSLIETVATLRYYMLTQYKLLFDNGITTNEQMKLLIDIDDRHLRGGRFDWDAFLCKRYENLKDNMIDELAIKNVKNNQKPELKSTLDKNKAKQTPFEIRVLEDQINVMTCIEHWAKESPAALVAYGLFCDLVHPNIGSSFMIASVNDAGKMYFTPAKGKSIGSDIFQQTFPMLVSVTHKAFGKYISLLIRTIWQDDELE